MKFHETRRKIIREWTPHERSLGVSRDVKRGVLHDLDRASLIAVEWPPRKTPILTLVLL